MVSVFDQIRSLGTDQVRAQEYDQIRGLVSDHVPALGFDQIRSVESDQIRKTVSDQLPACESDQVQKPRAPPVFDQIREPESDRMTSPKAVPYARGRVGTIIAFQNSTFKVSKFKLLGWLLRSESWNFDNLLQPGQLRWKVIK